MVPAGPKAPVGDAEGWTETPSLQCIGFDWSLRSDDAALVRYVAWLYDACTSPTRARHQFEMRRDTEPSTTVTLSQNGDVLVERVPAGLALARLVWEVNQGVTAHSGGRLLLHAAGADLDGRVVLLPGAPGVGKSTLVAALLGRGLRYVTDETVAVDPATLRVMPYPKPIALDPRSRVLDAIPDSNEALFTQVHDQRLLAPQVFGSDAVAPTGGTPRLLVFNRYIAGAPFALQPLHRAEAAVALAEQAFNFQSFGRGALAVVGDVVRTCRCYRMESDDVRTAAQAICDLLEESDVDR